MNLNGDNFKITRAGFSLTCLTCLTARVKKFAVKKNGTGDKMASETSGGLYNSSPDDEEDYDDPSELSIDAFLDTISDTGGGVSSLLACADLSSLKPEGPRKKADFWQKLCGTKSSTDLYITVYIYHSKQFPTACYMYHCSQVCEHQHKPRKGRCEGAKPCDKDAMDTFDCHGWLFITVTEGSDIVHLKFQHKDDHVPY